MDDHRTRFSDSRASSAYSNQSEQKPHYPWSSLASSGSRPVSRTSYTPSYMSIPRKPTPTSLDQHGGTGVGPERQSRNTTSASTAVESCLNAPPSSGPPGVLLVIVSSGLHPFLLQYLETLLTRQSFAGIVLAARREQEPALKQLKMDTYALIGKLRREMSVETQLKESWSDADMTTMLQSATRMGTSLQGVLACPDYSNNTEGVEVFELEENVLEQSWKKSVAFLHAAIRATTPQLLSRVRTVNGNATASTKPHKAPCGPFFVVASEEARTAASQIAKAASDALLQQLNAATKSKGLTVGNAETLLIPDPVVKEEAKPKLGSIMTNVGYDGHVQDSDFAAGESPTKLWALYDQLDRGF